MKRTNSVISSLYQPVGNSRLKTAGCMFMGGFILVCLGSGLIVTTMSGRRPTSVASHVDETSVLISGPTCLVLGLVVAVLSGVDMFRYHRARHTVESELNRVIGSMGKEQRAAELQNPKISIVVNKNLWPA